MPRKRRGADFHKFRWRTAMPDAQEKSFIQLGVSVLQNTKYQKLGKTSKLLFSCMDAEAAGKMHFRFTETTAKKYGIPKSSFLRARDELINAGVICFASPEHTQGEANEYKFIPDCWLHNE